MGYLDATAVLLKKNFLLSYRHRSSLLITLSSSFLSMLVLYFSQISINNGDGFSPELLDTRNPTPQVLGDIPRCVPFTHSNCFTIAYVPRDNPQVKSWVDDVAAKNKVPQNEIQSFQTGEELNSYLVANPNRTQAAYIFDADSLSQLDSGNVRFIVQYNETGQFEFPLGETDFHRAVVLPTMIHHMNLVLMPSVSGKQLQINLKTSEFPHPNILTTDDRGLDAFGLYGPLLVLGVYFLALVLFLHRIVEEKERGLRDAMKLAGQYQSQHFISWCIPFLFFNLILTLLIIAFGLAFDFKYFRVNAFSVYFLTLFIFSLSIISWAMLLATLTRRSRSVSVIGFNFFIFGYLLATSGSIVYEVDEFGEPRISDNTFFLRKLFAIFPSTMFVKALNDGNRLALVGIKTTFSLAANSSPIFPIRDCWKWMAGSTIVTLLLSIYLDNVIPTEHGVPLSPFYLFHPMYWGFGKSNMPQLEDMEAHEDEDTNSTESFSMDPDHMDTYDATKEDVDVRMERDAVNQGERNSSALLIKGVSKRFRQLVAVDDVSFSVKKNTAFALLGHNGAGKSTLFKMIVTALRPTGGDIFVYGLSVRHDQAAVRKLLGVCPQFDIYWDRLTGAEHVNIFAALKGYTREMRTDEIERRLADVDLIAQADQQAGTYSGGMQRRLSVALALTGDPKIVLLDECTSGADPLVRRDLWGAIERAKKGRVIFLITHSIAEAQHIAGHNSIGIMAKGKLRVLGNAMHLKTKFGAGFKITVILNDEENTLLLASALKEACPGTELASTVASDREEIIAHYELPRRAKDSQILAAVQVLESRKDDFKISDYSLNSTSLGEVFSSITSLSEDVHEDEDEKKKKFCCFG